MAFIVATWNVNSLRVRLLQVLAFLERYRPDIIALQETKIENAHFPIEAFRLSGYHAIYTGQKAYNGVALLSKIPLREVVTSLPSPVDLQCRFLSACLGKLKIINIYAPNGAQIGSDKYQYKLSWFRKLHDYLKQILAQHPLLLLMGDFNIAPQNEDVYDVNQWPDQILTTPFERSVFQKILNLGLYDTLRLLHAGSGHYTWWDYRQGAFYRNRGLRIDHILCSQALSQVCTRCEIDKQQRQVVRPSDHAPQLVYFQKSWYDFN